MIISKMYTVYKRVNYPDRPKKTWIPLYRPRDLVFQISFARLLLKCSTGSTPLECCQVSLSTCGWKINCTRQICIFQKRQKPYRKNKEIQNFHFNFFLRDFSKRLTRLFQIFNLITRLFKTFNHTLTTVNKHNWNLD